MSVVAWFRRLVSPQEFLPRAAVLAFVRDPLLGCLLEAALRPAGFDVLPAATIEEGLVTHWQSHREIALVVVCEPMPGLSLPQLLAGLRGADPSTPCCVWDAEGESPERDRTDLGAVTMARPATVAEMRRALLPLARPLRREWSRLASNSRRAAKPV
jgi:DNA-binding response OmpR family regulator